VIVRPRRRGNNQDKDEARRHRNRRDKDNHRRKSNIDFQAEASRAMLRLDFYLTAN
jgi:hypothetical protein